MAGFAIGSLNACPLEKDGQSDHIQHPVQRRLNLLVWFF